MSAEQGPSQPPTPAAYSGSGWTLLRRILVVVGIVLGCLILLADPFSYSPHHGQKFMLERSMMKGLEIAIKGYMTEYLRLPSLTNTSPTEDVTFDTTEAEGKALLEILLATKTERNPRVIRFWEPPPMKSNGSDYSLETGLKDRWGKGYRFIIDYNQDGKIANPEHATNPSAEPSELEADLVFYCAGPDGDFNTWKDNIRGWP